MVVSMALKQETPEHWRNSRRNRVALMTNFDPLIKYVERLCAVYNLSRPRSLSKDEAEGSKANLICLLLDLMACEDEGEGKWIGYSAGKQNYTQGGVYWSEQGDRPLISYTYFKAAIDLLEALGLVKNVIAPKGYTKYASRIKATEKLAAVFKKIGADWTIIKESPTAQSIVVKDENKRPVSWRDPEDFPLGETLENL